MNDIPFFRTSLRNLEKASNGWCWFGETPAATQAKERNCWWIAKIINGPKNVIAMICFPKVLSRNIDLLIVSNTATDINLDWNVFAQSLEKWHKFPLNNFYFIYLIFKRIIQISANIRKRRIFWMKKIITIFVPIVIKS